MRSSAIEFFVAFPLIWVFTLVAIGRLGGWARLARQYPARPQAGGVRLRFRSGRMRYRTGYGGCLILGADPAGLHLSIFFLFRPGHPPLFVPWPEVSAHVRSRHGVALGFARAPGVPLILGRSLAAKLADASAGGLRLCAPPGR